MKAILSISAAGGAFGAPVSVPPSLRPGIRRANAHARPARWAGARDGTAVPAQAGQAGLPKAPAERHRWVTDSVTVAVLAWFALGAVRLAIG